VVEVTLPYRGSISSWRTETQVGFFDDAGNSLNASGGIVFRIIKMISGRGIGKRSIAIIGEYTPSFPPHISTSEIIGSGGEARTPDLGVMKPLTKQCAYYGVLIFINN
jgi:hypothetical protein